MAVLLFTQAKLPYAGTDSSTNSDVGRTIEAATLNADNMTIQACLAFCTDQYYPYAGVEYFEQCCKSLWQDLCP